MAAESENRRIFDNVLVISQNDQIKELLTIIRDKNTTQSDFVFCADRLVRCVVEESLNLLPYVACKVVTPTDCTYDGVEFLKGNCGVSIIRTGEVMEKGLRECCRSIRIGKILVHQNPEGDEVQTVYAKLISDIHRRKVLLMYPVMSTGKTVCKAMDILREHKCEERNVILMNLFCTPSSIHAIRSKYPNMYIVTAEIDPVTPTHFGQKYFGTD